LVIFFTRPFFGHRQFLILATPMVCVCVCIPDRNDVKLGTIVVDPASYADRHRLSIVIEAYHDSSHDWKHTVAYCSIGPKCLSLSLSPRAGTRL